MGKKQRPPIDPDESRVSVAITIVWTLSVTTVLMCEAAALLAHFVVRWDPPAEKMQFFAQWMLLAGAAVGAITLALTPAVYRLRRVLPPSGFTVFAVCAALAPILAIIIQALG